MKKLTFYEVIEAKALLNAGQSHLLTARQFEVGKSTMRDIKDRKTWAWTDDLDPGDHLLINALLREGLTHKQVAEKFDLTYRQVAAIQN